jgi:hypothetical protein
LWGAIGANALRLAAPRPLVLQIGALAVIGAGALGLLLLVAPQCGTGAFAEMDPVVRKYWYSAVKEGLPVWNMPPLNAVTMIFTPLFGLLATAWYWRRASSAPERLLWLDLLLVLLGAYGVGLLVARASGTACVFAAVPVAALVRDGITALRTRGVSARIAGYAAAAVVLLPALPVFLWNAWSPASHDKPDTAFHVTRCQYAQAARALDRLPPTDLFAPLDIGPNLLVYSHHRVIATGHHRGSAAMRDVIDAFIGTPEQAHAIVRRRHATMVVLCPDINEPQYYADAAPDGLAARLLKASRPRGCNRSIPRRVRTCGSGAWWIDQRTARGRWLERRRRPGLAAAIQPLLRLRPIDQHLVGPALGFPLALPHADTLGSYARAQFRNLLTHHRVRIRVRVGWCGRGGLCGYRQNCPGNDGKQHFTPVQNPSYPARAAMKCYAPMMSPFYVERHR